MSTAQTTPLSAALEPRLPSQRRSPPTPPKHPPQCTLTGCMPLAFRHPQLPRYRPRRPCRHAPPRPHRPHQRYRRHLRRRPVHHSSPLLPCCHSRRIHPRRPRSCPLPLHIHCRRLPLRSRLPRRRRDLPLPARGYRRRLRPPGPRTPRLLNWILPWTTMRGWWWQASSSSGH